MSSAKTGVFQWNLVTLSHVDGKKVWVHGGCFVKCSLKIISCFAFFLQIEFFRGMTTAIFCACTPSLMTPFQEFNPMNFLKIMRMNSDSLTKAGSSSS
jgi:hypothetical protein